MESGGARAGLGSPGGAALGPVGGGRAELGSGRLDPAGFGGLGVADSVRGPLVRFWAGASGNPWTRLGLETLGWFRKGVGGNLKRLYSVGPECSGPLRWFRGSTWGIVGGGAERLHKTRLGALGL